MTEEITETVPLDLSKALEALLFVAPSSVALPQLVEVLGKNQSEIEDALKKLEQTFIESRGLRLQWHGGRVQLTTAPELSPYIEKFLGLDATARLSRAALEALAIIAYRQPITRPGIDAIRGVNSDGVLKNLLNKGLVEELGRADGPGRPIMYGTTSDFLQHFGLSSVKGLPPLDEEAKPANGEGDNRLLKD